MTGREGSRLLRWHSEFHQQLVKSTAGICVVYTAFDLVTGHIPVSRLLWMIASVLILAFASTEMANREATGETK
jgi:hypothetical protein